MKGKYIILLKFYDSYWKPYFETNGRIHCYDYEYAKDLYDKLCKNFKTSQWLLVKLEDVYSKPEEFCYIEGE